MSPQQTRITVLISGSGTNLQALIDAQETLLPKGSKIIRVISNKKDAFGITRAQAVAIPTSYHNVLKYKKDPQYEGDVAKARVAYDEDLAKLVLKDEPDLVVCAGFMHILSPGFLEPLENGGVKIINLHPGMFLLFLPSLVELSALHSHSIGRDECIWNFGLENKSNEHTEWLHDLHGSKDKLNSSTYEV